MKRKKSLMKKLFSCIVAIGVLFSPVVITGCTQSPKAIAYKTLKITKATADAAVDSFIDYDITKGAKTEDRQKVAELYNKFNDGFIKAVTAASLDFNALTPPDVQKLASDLITFVTSITTK